MLSYLQAQQGNQVILELQTGKKIEGTILEVTEKTVSLDTDKGLATVLVESVQIVWEPEETPLLEIDMDEIVDKIREIVAERYVCRPRFSCSGRYTCLQPHRCPRYFYCAAGRFYNSGGGGGCSGNFVGFRPDNPADDENSSKE